MQFYKDENGGMHYLENTKFEHLLPAGCVPITQEEAAVLQNPAPTPEQIQAQLEAAVDTHIDATAQADGWDSRITCALRAGYVNPWQAKGIAFGEWMDSCYVYCYQVLADVQAEVRTVPTDEELIAELPVMVWP